MQRNAKAIKVDHKARQYKDKDQVGHKERQCKGKDRVDHKERQCQDKRLQGKTMESQCRSQDKAMQSH